MSQIVIVRGTSQIHHPCGTKIVTMPSGREPSATKAVCEKCGNDDWGSAIYVISESSAKVVEELLKDLKQAQSEEPGTIRGRLNGIYRFAESRGYNPVRSDGPEGALFTYIEELEEKVRIYKEAKGLVEKSVLYFPKPLPKALWEEMKKFLHDSNLFIQLLLNPEPPQRRASGLHPPQKPYV
jgi:hypothetical protein